MMGPDGKPIPETILQKVTDLISCYCPFLAFPA